MTPNRFDKIRIHLVFLPIRVLLFPPRPAAQHFAIAPHFGADRSFVDLTHLLGARSLLVTQYTQIGGQWQDNHRRLEAHRRARRRLEIDGKRTS